MLVEQPAEAFGRGADQPGDARGIAAGFEKAFAQMDQVALRLQLAGRAARSAVRHRQAVERVVAEDDDVVRDDLAVFEREDVERAHELVALEEQRHRQPARSPSAADSGTQAARSSKASRSTRAMLRISASSRPRRRRRRRPSAAGCRRSGAGRGQRLERRARAGESVAEAIKLLLIAMRLRTLNVGCFGGGTGLPSLLGGLKSNPWLSVNAVVTMFDSGGSSGQLRDELGVLPPGRRAEVRAGARAQRARSAPRAAVADADARSTSGCAGTPAATCCCR